MLFFILHRVKDNALRLFLRILGLTRNFVFESSCDNGQLSFEPLGSLYTFTDVLSQKMSFSSFKDNHHKLYMNVKLLEIMDFSGKKNSIVSFLQWPRNSKQPVYFPVNLPGIKFNYIKKGSNLQNCGWVTLPYYCSFKFGYLKVADICNFKGQEIYCKKRNPCLSFFCKMS